MEKKWDDIDEKIVKSYQAWEPSCNYNERLLSKLRDSQSYIREDRIAGVSLVAAGLLLLLINTTTIQTKINEFQYELNSGVTVLKQDVSFTKYIMESERHGK